MANYNLTNQTISSSFQQLLQKDTDTGNLVDGLGNPIDSLTISGSTTSDFFIGDGSQLTNIPHTGSNTFDGDQVISGSVTIQDTNAPMSGLVLKNNSGGGDVQIIPAGDFITTFNDSSLTGIANYGGNTLSGSFGSVGNISSGYGVQALLGPANNLRLGHGDSYSSFLSNGASGEVRLRGDKITMQGSSSVDSGVSLTVNGDVSGSNFTGSFVGDGSSLTNLPIDGRYATTGSNTFQGQQTVFGDILQPSGDITCANGRINSQNIGIIQGASTFTGSFVGDGSGLTGIATPIDTGSFATTGSNTFTGDQNFGTYALNGIGTLGTINANVSNVLAVTQSQESTIGTIVLSYPFTGSGGSPGQVVQKFSTFEGGSQFDQQISGVDFSYFKTLNGGMIFETIDSGEIKFFSAGRIQLNNTGVGRIEFKGNSTAFGTNTAPGNTFQANDGNGVPRLQVNNALLSGITGDDVIVNGNLLNTGDATLIGNQTINGTNLSPGSTFTAKDGNNTPRLVVQNEQLSGITGIDVILNGNGLVGGNLTFPAPGQIINIANGTVEAGEVATSNLLVDTIQANTGTDITLNSSVIASGSITGSSTTDISMRVGRFETIQAYGYEPGENQDTIGFNAKVNVIQTFNVDGDFNSVPETTLNVKDGNGTARLQVNNATLSGLTGVDVNINGKTQITDTLTLQNDLIFDNHTMFNYGAYSSNVEQSGSAGVSQSIQLTQDEASGVSVVSGTQITVANAGTYSQTFSAQILADAGADTIYMWWKKNGVNIPNSATKLKLANNEENVMTVNFVDTAAAGDYYEIAWQSTTGDAVLHIEAASGNIPAIPSVIYTITQIR